MKVININVNRETYLKLQSGERLLDVRLDTPAHEKGDIMVYTMVDENGQPVEGANIAFLITTKVALEEFVERIGEQLLKKAPSDPEDMVIITLSLVPGQEDSTI